MSFNSIVKELSPTETLSSQAYKWPKEVIEVYKIFKDWFGDDCVDLQVDKEDESTIRYQILVYFPTITVTNEFDNTIDITNLYVKIPLTRSGTLQARFDICRSEYTKQQWLSHYCHSHTPRIDYEHPEEFLSPCLGDGPIRKTLISVSTHPSEELWKLFCAELSNYVSTESVSGGPYMKMEDVGSFHDKVLISNFSWSPDEFILSSGNFTNHNAVKELLKTFLSDLISSENIPFIFRDNRYEIAMSPFRWLLFISNKFISWINQNSSNQRFQVLIDAPYDYEKCADIKKLCITAIFFNGQLYRDDYIENTENSIKEINDAQKTLFTFKDEPVILYIIPDQTEQNLTQVTILKPKYAFYIRSLITIHANSSYAKIYNERRNFNNDYSIANDKIYYTSV